jgi:hypothetical protein
VRIAPLGPSWQRSSRCAKLHCVEVRDSTDGILVRDAKDPDGGRLAFRPDDWMSFLGALKSGLVEA